MYSNKCLNCDQDLQAKYCSHCGQKADTHRISTKHFIVHDLLHGVFHLDKGILFTIKQALSRPGKAATDYVKGKRISYYNIFYLTLILIGLNILFVHLSGKILKSGEMIVADNDGVKVLTFFKANIKYLILVFIPLFAMNALLLFRRVKYNFAEHHIVSGFALLGCTLFALVYNSFSFLAFNSWAENIVWAIQYLILVLIFLYVAFVYYSAFGPIYKKLGFLWRMIMMYLLFFAETIIILFWVLMALTSGKFEGTIQFK